MARTCSRCDFSKIVSNKCFCECFSKLVESHFRCDKFLPKGFRENQKQKHIESIIDNENRRKAYFEIGEWVTEENENGLD